MNRAAATKWKEIRPPSRRHEQCPSENNNSANRNGNTYADSLVRIARTIHASEAKTYTWLMSASWVFERMKNNNPPSTKKVESKSNRPAIQTATSGRVP